MKFYEYAEKRNHALMENTMKRMKSENVHVAALVTGGFHSEGISKLMDDEKLSYLIVMPKFDDKSADRPYVAILTKKPKEFEEAFMGQIILPDGQSVKEWMQPQIAQAYESGKMPNMMLGSGN